MTMTSADGGRPTRCLQQLRGLRGVERVKREAAGPQHVRGTWRDGQREQEQQRPGADDEPRMAGAEAPDALEDAAVEPGS